MTQSCCRSLLRFLALAGFLATAACNRSGGDAADHPAPTDGSAAAEAPPAAAAAEGSAAAPPAAAEGSAAAPAVDPTVAAEGSAAAPPVPPENCVGVRPERTTPAPNQGTPVPSPREPGRPAPAWTLLDVQPQSCGVGQHYGLDAFRGRVTMVVLLSATCGYCWGQAQKLEGLSMQLTAADAPVHIVILNQAGTEASAGELAQRTSLPIFQDTRDVNGWLLHAGHKDDFIIYDAEGNLVASLRSSEGAVTNLSAPDGFTAVKNALLVALGRPKE